MKAWKTHLKFTLTGLVLLLLVAVSACLCVTLVAGIVWGLTHVPLTVVRCVASALLLVMGSFLLLGTMHAVGACFWGRS